jgi:hypothetical protein
VTGTKALALARVFDPELDEAKRRFLDASMADRKGGSGSTGVRYWLIYCVYGLGASPIQDPRDASWETALQYEDRLEGMAVWIAVCKPCGNVVSHGSIKKYISSVRAWYRRWYRARLGLGAEGSRIGDVLKGYAREVPQPPPLERYGCAPRDLMAGLDRVNASQMWRSATTFAVAVLARGCEIALDSSRKEVFEISEHMTVLDVDFFFVKSVRHARVRMRKRKDLRVLRGKQATVIVAGGGSIFDAADELHRWIELRRALGIPDDAPLFCHTDGSMITVDQVRDLVKGVMEAVGKLPQHYGAHSLRIGGATAALAAGVPPQLIRLLGRWSSDVYQIYCRMSSQAAITAGQQLASSDVDAVEEFHEEHLELLPAEVSGFRDAVYGASADEAEEQD